MIPVLEFRLDGGRGFGSEEDLLGQLVEAACRRPLLTRRGKQERADKSGPTCAPTFTFSFSQKIFFLAVFGIRDILVRILLFLSMIFKTLTKTNFFLKILMLILF
jgi:hypothetical protein